MKTPLDAPPFACLLALLFTSGLTGCTDEPFAEPIDEPPLPCSSENLPDVPIVALDWDRLVETHLSPTTTAEQVGLDYFVSPAHAVNQVSVQPDFDPAVDFDGIRFDMACPRAIPMSVLLNLADNDVISVVITAGHSDTSTVRHGRATVPKGDRTMQIDISAIAGEPDWWFLFEPGRGAARLVLLPVDTTTAMLDVANLPRVAATVALVRIDARADAIAWDPDRSVAYSPPGFSSNWRSSLVGWHGAVLTDWSEDEPLRLSPLVDDAAEAIPVLRLEAAELDSDQPAALVQVPPRGAAGVLSVPCDQVLEVTTTGFVELVLGTAPDTQNVGPGVTHTVETSCPNEEPSFELPISGSSLSGRAGHVLVRIAEVSS